MSHTIKIFESDNEDHNHELMLRNKAVDMQIALDAINKELFRDPLKWNGDNLTQKQLDFLEKLREQFIKILDDNDVLSVIN